MYLAKLRRLSWPERRILFVALLALPASALGLRVWGISRIRDVLRRTQNHERSSREGEARSIARMVRIAAHHGLFRANCLEQSLTLWWLLKRRGIDTDLRIGAQKQEGKFAAHAWIELDGVALNDSDDVGERFGVFGAVHK